MTETIRIRRSNNVQFGRRLSEVRVEAGLPDVEVLKDELIGYTHVLIGRRESPLDSPYLALQEVATAYHSRAREMEMLIYDAEADGTVKAGSPLYKFRTGRLRSFIEMTKRLAELGSRRMSQEALLYEQRLEGGAS